MKKDIQELKRSDVGKKIEKKLKLFSSFSRRSEKEWFSELCFCLLTSNSKAQTALQIQAELGADGFCTSCMADVRKCIRKNNHRFHNNKSKFIVEARKHLDIKHKIQNLVKAGGQVMAREWLVRNVKGLGYKEASHFLRNVGYFDLAILDRHIVNLMLEHGMIKEKPKTLSKKVYYDIERRFLGFAKQLNMKAGELDMYMWYMKTGDILK